MHSMRMESLTPLGLESVESSAAILHQLIIAATPLDRRNRKSEIIVSAHLHS